VWPELRYRWNEARYQHGGQYEEESAVLRYDRNRIEELRRAVQAPTWAQMCGFPGVTNQVPFQPKYHLGLQTLRRTREIGRSFQRVGGGFLGQAAQAEAQRRILVAALALERYRIRHGTYPPTLAALTPEFLKAGPVDFMDGRPLRYQLNGAGHYRLYSVGLDGVDDGGKMAGEEKPSLDVFGAGGLGVMPKGDIVWPFPTSAATAAAMRQRESAAVLHEADEAELAQAEVQWDHAANHQSDVEKLLVAPEASLPDRTYHGRHLSEVLINTNVAGANSLTLRSLFTLKQVITGDEPERVTFELPVDYDALKRVGEIYLMIDTNNDNADEGCVAQQMDCSRAENGDCRLAWNTIFESYGKHALRVGLEPHGGSPDGATIVGPPLPFVISNLCQFSISSAHFDRRLGAGFQLKLPELNGQFILKCQTTNGLVVKTITGATTNGIVSVRWNLTDDHGRRLADDFFNTAWTITLPDSGRTQNLDGP
jgi:hypothetical protein